MCVCACMCVCVRVCVCGRLLVIGHCKKIYWPARNSPHLVIVCGRDRGCWIPRIVATAVSVHTVLCENSFLLCSAGSNYAVVLTAPYMRFTCEQDSLYWMQHCLLVNVCLHRQHSVHGLVLACVCVCLQLLGFVSTTCTQPTTGQLVVSIVRRLDMAPSLVVHVLTDISLKSIGLVVWTNNQQLAPLLSTRIDSLARECCAQRELTTQCGCAQLTWTRPISLLSGGQYYGLN